MSGSFSGGNASFCVGKIDGSSVTSYTVFAYRWTTGQTYTWTANNSSCYGAVLIQVSLPSDYYHIAAAGCNSSGCSEYRDMSNTSPDTRLRYWTYMPGGVWAGGSPDTNYHGH